jgi:SAM-dependent methyltransferase
MMPLPRDWDQHYSDAANLDLAPDPLLVQAADLLPPGRALDIACGAGRHALHLARLGWSVTAVDASPVAIAALRARGRGLAIDARVGDLEGGFPLDTGTYDLVCDFFYLQRNLFPALRDATRPGGAFAGAIHLAGPGSHRFVLEPGELRDLFAGWKILYYSEGGEGRPTARIVARKA